MDVYLNPQQNSYCVPEEFLYESSSQESSDKEELQLPKRRRKHLPQHKNHQTNGKVKKEKDIKILQNPLQPLITNKPDMGISLRLDRRTQTLPFHLIFSGLPPTNQFKEKCRPPPIIYRSREAFEAIPTVLSAEWIENELKKILLKAYYYSKAEDFKQKILRGEVFVDPKRIKFIEHKKYKALPKIAGQDL